MKIICVGRNYAEHAAELNNARPTEPILFLKPDTALLLKNMPFYYPDFSKDIHYECELVYRVGKQGKYIAPEFAFEHIDGVGLGIDFTARDLQNHQKAKGLPWEIAKAFNSSAVMSEVLPIETFSDHSKLRFHLEVNGIRRQSGDSSMMLFDLPTLIAYSSRFFTLKTGDLIYTGTPAGVGPIAIGDHLEGFLEGRCMFSFDVK